MQQQEFTVVDHGDGLYALEQPMVRAFLLVGDSGALLLDTGAVPANLAACVRELTGLPLTVVLTHGDGDHLGNLQDFSAAHVHPGDMQAVQSHENCKSVSLRPLLEGDVFDLGGRRLKALFTPGHTAGSVCLLDEQRKQLFTGDSVSYGPVYMFGPRRDMPEYLRSLHRLRGLWEDGVFTTVYCCHNRCPISADTVDELIACVSGILDKSIPGVLAQMPLPTPEPPRIGKYGSCAILFD